MHYLMLLGDSTPRDDHVRKALVKRLGVDVRQPETAPAPVEARVAALEVALDAAPGERFVLIGRSSGARVATLVAARPAYAGRIAAVVALGYPFRRPGQAVEPERVMHLRQIEVPCLIVQGASDAYGGRGDVGGYELSPRVRVRFVETDHRFEPTPEVWDDIAAMVQAFIGDVEEVKAAA